MNALVERFYIIILSPKDEVLATYESVFFPSADKIHDWLLLEEEGCTAKIDKRYVLMEV